MNLKLKLPNRVSFPMSPLVAKPIEWNDADFDPLSDNSFVDEEAARTARNGTNKLSSRCSTVNLQGIRELDTKYREMF